MGDSFIGPRVGERKKKPVAGDDTNDGLLRESPA